MAICLQSFVIEAVPTPPVVYVQELFMNDCYAFVLFNSYIYLATCVAPAKENLSRKDI